MTKKTKSGYEYEFKRYLDAVSEFSNSSIYSNTIESSFESLNDWSLYFTLEEVREWFLEKRAKCDMHVEEIPLSQVEGWSVQQPGGEIVHDSGDFFKVRGVRVSTSSREVESGWDQPILEQIGYDGGLLGILRQRHSGIPHYLCEAKMEPGNYGKIQISPTLQATFANIRKSHGGRRPHFLEFFEEEISDVEMLFDSWLAEDGGRLYLKRNRGMLVEVPQDLSIKLPSDNFIWLSLFQIKSLLAEDAWINPHVRGILAHI